MRNEPPCNHLLILLPLLLLRLLLMPLRFSITFAALLITRLSMISHALVADDNRAATVSLLRRGICSTIRKQSTSSVSATRESRHRQNKLMRTSNSIEEHRSLSLT